MYTLNGARILYGIYYEEENAQTDFVLYYECVKQKDQIPEKMIRKWLSMIKTSAIKDRGFPKGRQQ